MQLKFSWVVAAQIFAASCGGTTARASESIRVEIDHVPKTVRVDLGTRRVGDRTTTTLRLVNQTSSGLTIRTIDTDCGCVSAEPSDDSLDVDSTVDLAIELRPLSRIARVRRTLVVYFTESVSPLLIHLDVTVQGEIRLDRSEFAFDPAMSDRIELEGRKSDSVAWVKSCESARGAFHIVSSLVESGDGFRLGIRPTVSFGNASDLLRVMYVDTNGDDQLVELPLELRAGARIRFLPSVAQLSERDGQLVGRTRMVLSASANVDPKTLRFRLVDSNSGLSEQVRLEPMQVSPVLFLLNLKIDRRDGDGLIPDRLEVRDPEGERLGVLQLFTKEMKK